MLSIVEQIQGLRRTAAADPVTREQARNGGHKLSCHEIDEICRAAVIANPGSGIDEVHEVVEERGLSRGAVQVSLARLAKAARLIFVQRGKKEKARYWPDTMQAEADAFRNMFIPGGQEERIYNAMQPGVSYTTSTIAEILDDRSENILRGLKRLADRGLIKQKKGKVGKSIRWTRMGEA